MFKISGAYCAVLTPLNNNLSINNNLHLRHCQSLMQKGLDGLMSADRYQDNRSQNDATGLPRNYMDLKASYKMDSTSANEASTLDVLDISEYLDIKIEQNAQMTANIKSTLNRLDSKLGKPRSVISENNSSGEGDNE